MVAVLTMPESTPPKSTQFPALAIITSVRDLPRGIQTEDTVANDMSSASSGVYASPSTLTRSPEIGKGRVEERQTQKEKG